MDCVEVRCHSQSNSSSNGINDDEIPRNMGDCKPSVSCDKQHQPGVCPKLFLYPEDSNLSTVATLSQLEHHFSRNTILPAANPTIQLFSHSHYSSNDQRLHKANTWVQEQADKSMEAVIGITPSETAFNHSQGSPAPIIGVSSPTMSSSCVLRKRKHKQEADNMNRKEGGQGGQGGQASKRTREDSTVNKGIRNDSQTNVPPALGKPPIPIRSDIDVTTYSLTASPAKKKKHAFGQSLRPDAPHTDAVVDEDQSRPELHVLRSRIQELEEERNDYHNSLQKEKERAMERGRQLLLLQARIGTAKQREGPSTTSRQQLPLNNKNVGTGRISGMTEASRRHGSPTKQHISSGETEVPRDLSTSSNTRLERQLQQQVEDLSTRLSGSESEATDRVAQFSQLLGFKWQDEKFAAQKNLMRTEDCKLAQATKKLTKDRGRAKDSIPKVLSDETQPLRMLLDSTGIMMLRETNNDLSDKLRKCRSIVAEFQTEVRELRSSLETSAHSRAEAATTLEDVNQRHSREKATLEERIRCLESDIAQAHLKIEQFEQEKPSAKSLQDLVNENAENLARLRSSHTHDRQILVEKLETLGRQNKQLEAEKSSLAENLFKIKEEFQGLNLNLLGNQFQLRNAESKISSLEKTVNDHNSCLWNASTKHKEIVNALESRIKELTESLSKATTKIANRDKELNTLRESSLKKERALQKTREDLESTVDKLAARVREAAKAEAELCRLRPFEHAVTKHERAVKKREQGREEMVRQRQEQLNFLTQARKEVVVQRDQIRGLQQSNVSRALEARELETLKRKDEGRFVQFLQLVESQIRRQIEETWEGREITTEIGRPDEGALKQVGERLHKKLDMIEHELQWYRDDRATIYNEYRRLEQWRHEMASNVAARLSKASGPSQPGR